MIHYENKLTTKIKEYFNNKLNSIDKIYQDNELIVVYFEIGILTMSEINYIKKEFGLKLHIINLELKRLVFKILIY
jgi:hypothetical protein